MEAGSSAALEITNVTLRYGGVVALREVSFTVGLGEIIGLIGPNGAGKTSLTNVVTGAAGDAAGEISFFGKRVTDLPAYRRGRLGLARTFQVVRPLSGMTVLDNVVVGAAFGRGGQAGTLTDAMERAREALALVGLQHRADAEVGDLTLGDRQMLELARVIAGKPRVLILDEVMAGSTHVEVARKVAPIQELNQQGIAFIVIEHVMKAVMALSHRVVVLHHGQLLASGAPEDVTRDPRVIDAYLGERYNAKSGMKIADAVR
jgi:branched-chain amino acid transport system ATP-binding protein